MPKQKSQEPLEQLLGEIQSAFVAIEEVHLKELDRQIQEIKEECDRGYQAMERLHERLGMYKRSQK